MLAVFLRWIAPLLIPLAPTLAAAQIVGATIEFSWTNPSETDLSHNNIHWGTVPRPPGDNVPIVMFTYQNVSPDIPITQLKYDIVITQPGTYYASATVTDLSGQSSVYSNEISFTVTEQDFYDPPPADPEELAVNLVPAQGSENEQAQSSFAVNNLLVAMINGQPWVPVTMQITDGIDVHEDVGHELTTPVPAVFQGYEVVKTRYDQRGADPTQTVYQWDVVGGMDVVVFVDFFSPTPSWIATDGWVAIGGAAEALTTDGSSPNLFFPYSRIFTDETVQLKGNGCDTGTAPNCLPYFILVDPVSP